MLCLKIPFYESGRIANIHEEEKKYVVDRYGIDGKISKSLFVSKKQKNLEKLLDNYYKDLDAFLNKYKEKYELSLKNIFDKIGYMKNFKSIKVIPAILALTPIIGAMIESNFLMIVGIGLELLFIPSYVVLDRYSKLYEEEEKKSKFVKVYDDYKNSLEIYRKSINMSITPTMYKGVTKGYENSKTHIDVKKRILKDTNS